MDADPSAELLWAMYKNAKNSLENRTRMENLTWRMMFAKKRQPQSKLELDAIMNRPLDTKPKPETFDYVAHIRNLGPREVPGTKRAAPTLPVMAPHHSNLTAPHHSNLTALLREVTPDHGFHFSLDPLAFEGPSDSNTGAFLSQSVPSAPQRHMATPSLPSTRPPIGRNYSAFDAERGPVPLRSQLLASFAARQFSVHSTATATPIPYSPSQFGPPLKRHTPALLYEATFAQGMALRNDFPGYDPEFESMSLHDLHLLASQTPYELDDFGAIDYVPSAPMGALVEMRSGTASLAHSVDGDAAYLLPSSWLQSYFDDDKRAAKKKPKKKDLPFRQNNANIECFNCHTKTTPLWRRDPQGEALCNACGLFQKLHGTVRPLSLKTDVIKKRQRGQNTRKQLLARDGDDFSPTPINAVRKRERRRPERKRTLKTAEMPEQAKWEREEVEKDGKWEWLSMAL